MNNPSIYSYVETEESKFQTDEIRVGDNWSWNLRNHVQLIFHLKNGLFFTGENNWLRPFKNIMEPILELCSWTEDIELKDVVFYIENANGRVLSFLVKKYYDEVYVKENDLDTFIDELIDSDLEYGGVTVQKTNKARPEVLPLNQIAFCDQTDLMGGPIAFKHYFSPDKLRKMESIGWGDDKNGATISLEELCTLASHDKEPAALSSNGIKNKTPGKNIEVYIIRGNLPEHYLLDNDEMDYYCNQVQVIAFYTDPKKRRIGVTLYRKKETEGNLKFFTSKKVEGRALGRGIGERLLHPQVWTNFATIHKTKLLEAASKVPLMTDDPAYANRNQIQDMETLEITVVAPDTKLPPQPIQTASPVNIQLIENSIDNWFQYAQLAGAAFDPIMGQEQASGTTFKGQERTVQQGRGPHDKRRGKRAKFIEEIYRDWIIPHMAREITKGKKFLATLTAEEMTWVAEQLAENYANRKQIDAVLDAEIPDDKEILKTEFKERFSKSGTKHLLEILKDEFEDVEIKMGINVAGKQKDLAGLSDKVLNIFQFIIANPVGFQQAMQIPGMARAFQDILEYSGINSVDFMTLAAMPPVQDPALQQTKPQQMLPKPVAA